MCILIQTTSLLYLSYWNLAVYMNECTEISRKGAQGGRQKKLKKITKKALEKFRLPAPSSARSDLRLLRNHDLKIGTFSKIKKKNYVFTWTYKKVSRSCWFELKLLLEVFLDEHYLKQKFQVNQIFSCRDSNFSK